jgi:cobalamin-dependent methionine synthase I
MPIIELPINRIDNDEVIRLSGGGDPGTNTDIQTTLYWAVDQALTLIESKGIYKIFPASSEDTYVKINHDDTDAVAFPYPGTDRISGIEAAVVFVVTIGNMLEKEVESQFNDNNHLGGLFLDSTGSVAAEAIADRLAEIVADSVKDNDWKTGYRISPGYCTWNMELQSDIFRMLSVDRIGVTLSDSMLMLPRKSISGVLFLGKELNPLNPCESCNRWDCKDRRS